MDVKAETSLLNYNPKHLKILHISFIPLILALYKDISLGLHHVLSPYQDYTHYQNIIEQTL